MSLNSGTIWWSELMTGDVDGAIRYYGEVCGWSFDRMQLAGTDYVVAIAHGKPVAGIMSNEGVEDMGIDGPAWFTYVAVDDVQAAVEQTMAIGGNVLRPPFDVPHVGRVAIVRDPTGTPMGLMTPVFPLDETVANDGGADWVEDEDSDRDFDNFPV